jgi:hypothetical protein
MKPLTVCGIALVVGSIGGAVGADAQERADSWVVTSTTSAGQRYPTPGFSLSEAQRRGMRLGAQIGMFAGVGIAWMAWTPDDDDECPNFECLGRGMVLPLYLVGGMLGGMVAGGAVGLGVGTLVDDDGARRSALELRVRLAP